MADDTGMIAEVDGFLMGSGGDVLIVLPASAHEALASVAAVTEMTDAVGKLAVDFGMGQPLASFQSLMKTYQMLAQAQAALWATAQYFLSGAKPPPLNG